MRYTTLLCGFTVLLAGCARVGPRTDRRLSSRFQTHVCGFGGTHCGVQVTYGEKRAGRLNG